MKSPIFGWKRCFGRLRQAEQVGGGGKYQLTCSNLESRGTMLLIPTAIRDRVQIMGHRNCANAMQTSQYPTEFPIAILTLG